jgi:hypothetical protein
MLTQKVGRVLVVHLFLLPIALANLWGQNKSAPVGDVLQLKGSWRIAGQTTDLTVGEGLQAGSVIRPDGASKNDFVVVVLLNGQRLAATCLTVRCDSTVQIPDPDLNENVSFRRILEAVRSVLSDSRPGVTSTYWATSSRDIQPAWREMVVPYGPGNQVSLSAMLKGLGQGRYHFEMRHLPDDKIVSAREWPWDGRDELTAAPPMVGLFVITLDDDLGRPALNVLLFATPAESEPGIRNAFEQARQACAKWEGPEAETSAHFFLRSYLFSLAAQR